MDNQETHPGVDTEHHGARRRALLGAGLGGAALSLLPFLSGRAAAASDSTVATTTTAPPLRPTDADIENFIDFYHVNVVHTTTNGRDFTKEAYRYEPRPNGGYKAEYNSGPSTFSKKPVFGKMPWMQDYPESHSVTALLPPNFTFFGRVDDVLNVLIHHQPRPVRPGSAREPELEY